MNPPPTQVAMEKRKNVSQSFLILKIIKRVLRESLYRTVVIYVREFRKRAWACVEYQTRSMEGRGKNFRPNDVALMKRRFSNRIWG